jgi:hypothetical protein
MAVGRSVAAACPVEGGRKAKVGGLQPGLAIGPKGQMGRRLLRILGGKGGGLSVSYVPKANSE